MKKALFAALSAIVLFSAGCTGPFNLTRTVHRWHSDYQNKVSDEVAFLGCAIFQVYTFALIGDAVIFNSIEFWTDENPIRLSAVTVGDASIAPQADGSVRVSTAEGVVTLARGADGVTARDAAGRVLATARADDATVTVTRADGSTQTFSRDGRVPTVL